jgi:hypothetical protein
MQVKDEREKQRLREQLEEQESRLRWLEYQARVYSHEDQNDDR